MNTLAAHTPTAVPGDGVQLDRESLRVFNLCQMGQGTRQHLLHRVLGVLRMSAYLHAEGINRVLQQANRLFDTFRSIAVQ